MDRALFLKKYDSGILNIARHQRAQSERRRRRRQGHHLDGTGGKIGWFGHGAHPVQFGLASDLGEAIGEMV